MHGLQRMFDQGTAMVYVHLDTLVMYPEILE